MVEGLEELDDSFVVVIGLFGVYVQSDIAARLIYLVLYNFR